MSARLTSGPGNVGELPVRLQSLDAVVTELGIEEDDGVCHCGKPVAFGYDGDPEHHRGMCAHCDSTRCDAYPGECGR